MDPEKVVPVDGNNPYREKIRFVFDDYPIPGPHSWGFSMDEQGVLQVYEETKGDSGARDVNVH